MNIKLIRMSSGEDVIADIVEEDSSSITVRDPIYPVPTQDGKIGFGSWAPFVSPTEPEIVIKKDFIVFIAELNQSVKDEYHNHYGKIVLTEASKKKLIL